LGNHEPICRPSPWVGRLGSLGKLEPMGRSLWVGIQGHTDRLEFIGGLDISSKIRLKGLQRDKHSSLF
jgi:hypothetical protein